MFRNFFQEPKPGNHAELIETFDELGLNPATSVAIINDYTGQNDAPYDGWCAEITGEDEGGETKTFDTVAWASLGDIRNDLEAAGLTNITVE